MQDIKLSSLERFLRARIQHYDEGKYWRYRESIISSGKGGWKNNIINYFKLLYVKKCDAWNNASTGAFIGHGATFSSIPNLPHGLYGIIISCNASIGKNVTIFHSVTIGDTRNGSPTIGDNVYIGAGAIIIGNVIIGNNAKIGAGCIVTQNIPDYATVVSQKPRIIMKKHHIDKND